MEKGRQHFKWTQDVETDHLYTINSADVDKPRDMFKGQSRSPNMVPFDMLDMVSY